MTNKMTRDAWIAHGFFVLKTEGHEALKADKMVKALGVSRGSFYWHFENIEAFQKILICDWRKQQIEHILAFLKATSLEAAQVQPFVESVLQHDHPFEAAMRRWAGAHKLVAEMMGEIDRLRTRYLQHLLMETGVSHAGSKARASLLNAAFVGMALGTSIGQPANSEWAAHITKMILKPE